MNTPVETNQTQPRPQPAPATNNEHRNAAQTTNPDSLEHVVVLGYN